MSKCNNSSDHETTLDIAKLDTVVAGASFIGVAANRQPAKLSSGSATVFGAMGMNQAATVS